MVRKLKNTILCGLGFLAIWSVAAIIQNYRIACAKTKVPDVKIQTTKYAQVSFMTPQNQSFKFGYTSIP